MSPSNPVFDVLIIGGGPAGLSTALALSRALHTAVLFDSGTYRNGLSNHMHIVPTWDHRDPAEFRAASRKELSERYDSVRIEDCAIDRVEKLENGWFKATDATQRVWTGKKLVLATGSKDVFPDIPGYEDCWVNGIFHCLFCHGFEERGTHSVGVLAVGDVANLPFASHLALQARTFSKKVTVYTNGSAILASELSPPLTAKNIQVDARPIRQLIKNPGNNSEVIIVFANDEREKAGFLVHKPKTELASPLAQQLGLELTPSGDIKVGQPIPETSVEGVFAAGDCSTGLKMVANALSSGIATAAGLSMQLQKDI